MKPRGSHIDWTARLAEMSLESPGYHAAVEATMAHVAEQKRIAAERGKQKNKGRRRK